jgi:hypothetical protein
LAAPQSFPRVAREKLLYGNGKDSVCEGDLKSLLKVGDEVVGVLKTERKANGQGV